MDLFRVTAHLTGPMGRSAVALESLLLAADPVARRLVPVKGFVGVT
jgi:hypothetical protein